MIHVFRTSVFNNANIEYLKPHLEKIPHIRWNFDLDDCDKILRIDSSSEISENVIVNILHNNGFDGEVLLN